MLSWLFLILILFLLLIPFILTIKNISEIFSRKKELSKRTKRIRLISDMTIMILGTILTIVLFSYVNNFKDWYTQLTIYVPIPEVEDGIYDSSLALHSMLATWAIPSILTLVIVSVVSYVILRLFKDYDLPPLVNVICMAGMYIGIILSFAWIIQITGTLIRHNRIIELYLIIFPINYIICSAKLIVNIIKNYKGKDKKYKNKFLNKCNKLLQNSKDWPIYALILMIPILAIIIIILTLFGQQPDAIIQAFTQTSDWAFSLKEAPLTVVVPSGDGHYLCTVSLKGHKKLVKPLRYGIRRNQKIVVNRQLCVANAFEDLIHEKLPRFHKFIRNIYDKYGYPLSKHINTAISADIIYILMKPLEYIFLTVLYLFDKKPENRIAVQYLPKTCVNGDGDF